MRGYNRPNFLTLCAKSSIPRWFQGVESVHVKLFLSTNAPLRLTTLCVLYAAQGIPDGFVRIALKTYLIGQQVSTEAVGTIVAMVSWPWALKWVWGPFIDRFGYRPMGRRRPWILAAQLGMAVTLGTMLFIPELTTNIRAIAVMVLLVNIFASLQDVSVDALAVDLLPAEERGIANGFMYGSNYVGSYIGGAVLGSLILWYGFPTAITTQVSLLLLIALVPLFLRERPGDVFVPGPHAQYHPSRDPDAEGPASLRDLFRQLLHAFMLRSSLLGAVLAVLALITVNSHLIVWPVYLQRQLGWTSAEWLHLEGQLAVWLGLGGSLAGGVVASILGAKRTVILSLALLATCWLLYYLLEGSWTNHTVVTLLFLFESVLAAFLQVSMFALFMGLCSPKIAATQFTAYMALLNVSNGIGAKLAGTFEQELGVSAMHLALAGIQITLVVVVLGINPQQVREELDDEEETAGSTG